jgi:hypothetical protein
MATLRDHEQPEPERPADEHDDDELDPFLVAW